jgi:hypothetical protein
VDHATETIAPLHAILAPLRRWRRRRAGWAGRCEAQRSMGPMAVVMLHEDVEDPLKMRLVQDQQPVETF